MRVRSLTVTAVLSVGESRVTQLLLERNDILDILLLDSLESRLGGLALLVGGLDVEELISTEEGAEMLSPEGRVVVELRGHCEESVQAGKKNISIHESCLRRGKNWTVDGTHLRGMRVVWGEERKEEEEETE